MSAGPITLERLHTEPEPGDAIHCRATLTVDERLVDMEATAFGTIGAMSEMLYGLGAGVEIVSLYHQNEGPAAPDGSGGEVSAYLMCRRDGACCWAHGRAATGDEATIRALISAANQLTGRQRRG